MFSFVGQCLLNSSTYSCTSAPFLESNTKCYNHCGSIVAAGTDLPLLRHLLPHLFMILFQLGGTCFSFITKQLFNLLNLKYSMAYWGPRKQETIKQKKIVFLELPSKLPSRSYYSCWSAVLSRKEYSGKNCDDDQPL